ncbi:helix-turn-helix transcriptional regulator [Tomitella gaofuii]|uniref:helix-turn-helix transcriptional regulator n=1 Tax=Tomitella gaofuii TaxID=2760083 RepID=UPI0015FE667A|nr:helix-turn-helix transcriptional regulator [Tomitella gaofuii]
MDDSALFRTMRETLGLTHDDAGELCGVAGRTVRRWESPDETWPPPADAMAAMQDRWAAVTDRIGEVLESLPDPEDEFGETETVRLVRWPSNEAWLRDHPGEQLWSWKMDCAAVGLTAVALDLADYPRTITWAE